MIGPVAALVGLTCILHHRAAFIAFNVFGSTRAGWILFAGALTGPLVALSWHMARRERPDSFAIVPAAALLLFALLFTLTEGLPWA